MSTATFTAEEETFAAIPTWVVMHPELPDAAVRLYAVLKGYARMSEQAWPRRERLAQDMRCSPDKIDRTLRTLIDAGALRVTRRWQEVIDGDVQYFDDNAPGRSPAPNLYFLVWSEPGAGSPPTEGPKRPKTGGGSRTDAARGRGKSAPTGTRTDADSRGVGGSRTDAARGSRTDAARSTYIGSTSPSLRSGEAHPAKNDSSEDVGEDGSAPTPANVVSLSTKDPAARRDTTRGTRLPEDWRPSPELAAWTLKAGATPEWAKRTLANFRDYWLAKAGAGARKADWDRTWQRWVRTELERNPPPRRTPVSAGSGPRAWDEGVVYR